MKVICAWCGDELREIDGEGREGISHGICEECSIKVEASSGLQYQFVYPIENIRDRNWGDSSIRLGNKKAFDSINGERR